MKIAIVYLSAVNTLVSSSYADKFILILPMKLLSVPIYVYVNQYKNHSLPPTTATTTIITATTSTTTNSSHFVHTHGIAEVVGCWGAIIVIVHQFNDQALINHNSKRIPNHFATGFRGSCLGRATDVSRRKSRTTGGSNCWP